MSSKYVVEKVTLERRMAKRSDNIRTQIRDLINKALSSNRGSGWTGSVKSVAEPKEESGNWVYTAELTFSTTSQRESLARKWPKILERLSQAGCAGAYAKTPYIITSPTGFGKVAQVAKERVEKVTTLRALANEDKQLGEINLEKGNHFDRIYGRDAQIRRVLDALMLAKKTNFFIRTHSLLDGPPGSGKTEIMKAIASMLGEENKAWMWLDATSMTKAGVIEMLMESPVVPPICFCEEIEKTSGGATGGEENLRWLLGILDTRARIQRTNYRVGNQARNVKMVVIATANDVSLLKKVMAGALYSRFQNKIYCPPPDRKIMEQILKRHIKEINEQSGENYAKVEWIEPVLQFAMDRYLISDPRQVISMLLGQERLLTGAAQKDWESTLHPQERKDLWKNIQTHQHGLEEDGKIMAEIEKTYQEKFGK